MVNFEEEADAPANLFRFDVKRGRQKPETIVHTSAPCPFCDVAHLRDIIDTDGDIILLKNKYNVIEGADQFVIIEGADCEADMPSYTREHMRRLVRFCVGHWRRMSSSGLYESAVLFKNYGPLSGGTIRHPHQQIVGFPHIRQELLYSKREFAGLFVTEKDGVTLNLSTSPRVGFVELNLLPQEGASLDTLADFIQIGVDYVCNRLGKRSGSYNIFFYQDCEDKDNFFVKIMPRFATSPLFIGYNIRFLSGNIADVAGEIRKIYFDKD